MFGRKRSTKDFRSEVQSHIDNETQRLRDQGISDGEARAKAQRTFGNVTGAAERFYESRRWLFWDHLSRDVRFAFRVLRKSPGFTAVTIATLALAIGANSVVFGVLNALVLRPLNVPQAERLYQLFRGKDNAGNQSFPDYLDLRDRNRTFDELIAYDGALAGIDTGGNPASAWVVLVTGNYFDGLRLQPYLGRFFHSSDEHGPNSAPYMVLTYAYWHTHFQNDPGVVGRVVQVNKNPFTIVGVAPKEFRGTLVFFSPDFFLPIVNQEQVEGKNTLNDRGKHWVFSVIGHLKAGVTPGQAIADLNSIGAEMGKTYPKDDEDLSFTLGRPNLYGDYLGRSVRAFMTGLMLLTGLILLAACTNLGSLFTARAADRSREVALRLALGAGRLRILRQLLTEAMLISLIGGAIGLAGSIALMRAVSQWQPFTKYPIQLAVNPDASVYGVALILALVSALIFGAVPVRQIMRTDPYQVIKTGSSGGIGRRMIVRDLLLAVQIALCAVLVTSSLVAVRGLMRSLHSRFGFEPERVLLADVDLAMAGYRIDATPAMQKRMLDAVGAIPGVEAVGLVNPTPLYAGAVNGLVFSDKTADLRPANAAAEAFVYRISPEYFLAAGTVLLGGRSFTWHDDRSAPRIAVVNAEFARKIFGSVAGALGGYYKIEDGTRVEVVGVAEQGKYHSLTEDAKPAMFFPLLQSASSETWMVVRSTGNPQRLAPVLRNVFRELDSGLPVYIQTWTKELDHALFAPRMATLSLGVLGMIGAMLSVTGIFGMAAYSVSKRLRQLGIRMALGAQRGQVLQAALGRAFRLLVIGSAAGLALGVLASRVLASIVYQATPRDPLVLAEVVFAMLLLGLLATWIPARRAISIDPAVLLREE